MPTPSVVLPHRHFFWNRASELWKKQLHWQRTDRLVHRGSHLHPWWEGQLVQPPWLSYGGFLKDGEQKLDLTVPLGSVSPKDSKSTHQRDACASLFCRYVREPTEASNKKGRVKRMRYISTEHFLFVLKEGLLSSVGKCIQLAEQLSKRSRF